MHGGSEMHITKRTTGGKQLPETYQKICKHRLPENNQICMHSSTVLHSTVKFDNDMMIIDRT